MQTVLKELKDRIDLLSQYLPMNNERNRAIIDTYAHCSSIVASYFQKEKEQIRTAYLQGNENGFHSTESQSDYETESRADYISEQYYSQTFKND